MKKRNLIILPALLVLLTVIGTICYGVSGTQEEAQTPVTATAKGDITVQKDGLTLSYDEEQKNFTLTDPSGYVWNSAVYDDLYSSDLMGDLWLKKVRSILHISYADISKKNPTLESAFSIDAEVGVKQIENGLELAYYFKKPGISLVCRIELENGELVITIPASGIKEEKKHKLVTAEVLPYFGACADGEEGYLMYPDGSGAIKYHTTVPPATMSNTWYTWDIYGNDLKTMDTLLENRESDLQTAMLPVFGIKKGDHAFIAFSQTGEEEGCINMYPSGYGVALNRMSMSFRYRTRYDIQMSNININGNNTAQNINGMMYNQEMILADHDVHYSFLSGDQADYSGMANRYRQILLEGGDLRKSELVDSTSVAVNILMAASEQGFWSDSVAVTTTPGEAQQIMDYVKDLGFGDSGVFTLKGWSKGGYGVYPQTAKPDGQLGNTGKLAELMQANPQVLLQTELILAGDANGGVDKAKDLAKQGNQNVITDTAETVYLFNPQNVEQRLEKLLDTYSFAEKVNLSLSSVGTVLYRDENDKNVMHRGAVRNVMEQVLEAAAARGTVSVSGANQYTLAYADMIFDLPVTSSEYFISDMDIPFCQMVLHGSVVYTGDYGNLSSDYAEQLLKWLEYGYTPAFELTACDSEKLKNTNCSSLYSSQYESNRQRLEEACQFYQAVLSKVDEAYITKHTVLEPDLVQVEYSNGYTIVINYTNRQKQYGEISVAAGGYAVIGE